MIHFLYRKLLYILFPTPPFSVAPERALKIDLKAGYKTDVAVFLDESLIPDRPAFNIMNDLSGCLFEFQVETLSPGVPHKDEQKLLAALTRNLISRIKRVLMNGPDAVNKLTILGFLVGGTVVQPVVGTPFFGAKDAEGRTPISVAFNTSMKYGRLPLFETGLYTYTDNPPNRIFSVAVNEFDIDSASSDRIVPLPDGFDFKKSFKESMKEHFKSDAIKTDFAKMQLRPRGPQSPAVVEAGMEAEDPKDPIYRESFIEVKDEPSKKRNRASSTTSSFLSSKGSSSSAKSSASVSNTSSQRGIQIARELKSEYMNAICDWGIRGLVRFVAPFRNQELYFKEQLEEAERGKAAGGSTFNDDAYANFYFAPVYEDGYIPRAEGPGSSSRRPELDDLNTPAKGRQMATNIELNPISVNIDGNILKQHIYEHGQNPNAFNVLKLWSQYETTIYELDAVKASPFFGRLLGYSDADKGKVFLSTHKLSCSLQQIQKVFPFDVKVEMVDWLGSSLLLGVMCALETLHSAGYVHSDLSPGNVCFSAEERVWKLIDFNQSMPIQESLETKRVFGTRGYRNPEAYEAGIVTPVDDYIALANVLRIGFPEDWFLFTEEFIDFLDEIITAKYIDEHWREKAIEFHRKSCRGLNLKNDLTLKYAEQL